MIVVAVESAALMAWSEWCLNHLDQWYWEQTLGSTCHRLYPVQCCCQCSGELQSWPTWHSTQSHFSCKTWYGNVKMEQRQTTHVQYIVLVHLGNLAKGTQSIVLGLFWLFLFWFRFRNNNTQNLNFETDTPSENRIPTLEATWELLSAHMQTKERVFCLFRVNGIPFVHSKNKIAPKRTQIQSIPCVPILE